MERERDRGDRDKKKPMKPGGRIFKKRPCRLCKEKVDSVNFMNIELLSRYVSDRGRIVSSRINGNCSKHQRMIALAVKKARLAALLPFVRVTAASPHQRRPRRPQ